MLGLADRAQTITLFEQALKGQTAQALQTFRDLYGFGADPAQVTLDLLEHCHSASIAKALGPQALTLPKDQAARLTALGTDVSAGTLARLWQMLLKAHEEVRRASDPTAAAEMALIRLCYAADLPGPEAALKALQSGDPMGGGSGGGAPSGGGGSVGATALASQAMPRSQAAPAQPTLKSFEDVLTLIASKRDIMLKTDVERFVRPISFRMGAIEFEPAPGCPNNLAQRLASRLKDWTGETWLVAAQGGGGAETAYEREKRERAEARARIEADPFIKSVMEAFPGAEILSVRKTAAPEAEAVADPEAADAGDED
jgi:DNA polymerase-3 subunit gamma/tau